MSKPKKKVKKAKEGAHVKKDRTSVVLIVLCCVLAAGLLIFGTVMAVRAIRNAYLDSGAPYRGDVILKTEHYSVNGAMLSYRFYDVFYNEALHTGYDDPDQLRQVASPYENMSLYEYDRDVILTSLDRTLRYAEKAASEGKTLDEYDLAVIENRIQAIRNAAVNRGEELEDYMFATYGRGVRLTDVEDLLKIEVMAEKQWNAEEATVTVSETEIDEYLSKRDENEFLRFDYYIVTLDPTKRDDHSADAEIKRASARENAARLAAASSPEEFRALAKTYKKIYYESDSDVTEENFEEIFAGDCHFVGVQTRTVGDDAPESTRWLFSPDRKTGDVYLDEKESVVYYIERSVYSVDLPNDAFRVIHIPYGDYPSRSDALNVFNRMVAEFEKTDRGEEAFIDLLLRYEHGGANLSRQGYYDNTAVSSPFNDLLADLKTRLGQEGKSFESGKTYELYGTGAVYFLYCLGQGGTRSRTEAREAIVSAKCDEAYAAIKKNFSVSFTAKEGDRIAPRTTED